jgi:polyhydroxyalkanoate synthesis regulator phasin
MATNDAFRKYIEAGAVLGHVTRARAEEIVRELVNAGDLQRGQASQWVDEIVERSKKASEDLMSVIRKEVTHQLDTLGIDADDLAKQVADILRHSADVGRSATTTAASSAAGRVGDTAKAAKKAATKMTGPRSGANKAARKTATAAAKKAAPKKASAKKAPAKKPSAAKKVAKKAPAKRSAAKRAGATKKAAPRSSPASGR